MASTLRFDNWENSNGDSIGTAANGYLGVPGTVLQVVQTFKTDSSAISASGSTLYDIPGMSASITPKSSTSKILVSITLQFNQSGSSKTAFRLFRDSTEIGKSTASTDDNFNGLFSTNLYNADSNYVYTIGSFSSQFLDSTLSSQAVTYSLKLYPTVASTFYINRRSYDEGLGGTSNITLMEIAG